LGFDSLHSEPGFFLQFPKEEERDKGVKRMVDWWLGDPTATYMKVIDSETGKFHDAFRKSNRDILFLVPSTASEYPLMGRNRKNH
jgi:hypothetical protein